ncbi:hypothetical protein [Vagococcus sp.]|uniref:hypothetical protein n=1 Tax=Vagococcus sp. TaxID=1933889 RepID=UPI003F9D8AD1
MNQEEWLLHEIDQLMKQSKTYQDWSFYLELKKIVREQYRRIELAEGELDGTLWSPKNW